MYIYITILYTFKSVYGGKKTKNKKKIEKNKTRAYEKYKTMYISVYTMQQIGTGSLNIKGDVHNHLYNTHLHMFMVLRSASRSCSRLYH
jgi:hypothetical protein